MVVGASASPRTTPAISAATATSGTGGASQASNPGKIYFGVDGTLSSAANGMNVARHIYGQVGGNVPMARVVTMGTSGMSYAEIANAQQGSSTYNNIVRWADTIKSRGSLTFFGFAHEPESKTQARFGSAAQYIAAYRHVTDIIRSRGVSNVRFVWQMTAFGFRRQDSQAAINYYPGDAYVDDIGADPYNWGACGSGGGQWVQLATVTDPVLAFARAHDKLVMLTEFASQSGPGRTDWLNSAHQYLVANRAVIQGAFYFDRPPPAAGTGCNWSLTGASEIQAFRSIVNDTAYFTS